MAAGQFKAGDVIRNITHGQLDDIDPNEVIELDRNGKDVTYIKLVAMFGTKSMMLELLKKEPDVDRRHLCLLALDHCNIDIAEIFGDNLIEFLNMETTDSCHPMWVAIERNHIDVIKRLYPEMTHPVKDINGKTILHHLAFYGDPSFHVDIDFNVMKDNHISMLDMMEYIKDDYLPEINTADKTGLTALHLASYVGNVEIVNWLLDHGARMDLKAVDLAEQRGHAELAEIMKKRK